MENKSIQIIGIILLAIIAISLLSIMILAIINKDYKVSLFAFGNKTNLILESEFNINEVKDIDIKDTSANVKFVEGNSDKIKVTIYGYEDAKYKVDLEEDKLIIAKESKTFHMFVFFAWAREEVIVELPKNYDGNVRNRSIKW